MGRRIINGVSITPLKEIPTNGGVVLHMLRADSPVFLSFGEIYFSEVKLGIIKGWKRHFEMSQNFAVPRGLIKFVLYDDRTDSPTCGLVQECILGRPDSYCLLSMPPLIWYSFACISKEEGLISNLASRMHCQVKSEQRALECPEIPYSWGEDNGI